MTKPVRQFGWPLWLAASHSRLGGEVVMCAVTASVRATWQLGAAWARQHGADAKDGDWELGRVDRAGGRVVFGGEDCGHDGPAVLAAPTDTERPNSLSGALHVPYIARRSTHHRAITRGHYPAWPGREATSLERQLASSAF